MEDNKADIVTGRKVFFVTPNTSIFPETYLQDYLEMGYEAYFISNDKACPLEKKIKCAIQIFPDAMFFFFIDSTVPGVDWPVFVKSFQDEYGGRALFGVMFAKRQSAEEKSALERYYLYDVGVKCGCAQLEYKREENFNIVKKILAANQARGRRRFVRAICQSNCSLSFRVKKERYLGKLNDISVCHFSTVISNCLPIPSAARIDDVQINLKGLRIHSAASLLTQRETPSGVLYVFSFVDSAGKNSLDIFSRQLLVPKIYEIMVENCSSALNALYYGRNPELNAPN